MKNMKIWILLLMLVIFTSCSLDKASYEKIETPYYGIKPNTLDEGALNKKVIDAFERFEKKYFKKVPNKDQMYLDYILDERQDPNATWVKRNAITVSEAHGYAMVLLGNLANMDIENSQEYKETFDEFYNFYKAHPSQYTEAFMCWQILGRGISMASGEGELTETYVNPTANSSAIDGDMDIAYALIIADNIWGSHGRINYRAEGLKIIEKLYDVCVHPENHTLLLGDWVKDHSSDYNLKLTRSSDFMINHLKTFAQVDEKNRKGWQKVIEKTEKIALNHYKNHSANTGLFPDFFVETKKGYIPSQGYALESEFDGDYNWNACRTTWRLSRDYLTTGDTALLDISRSLDTFIQKKAQGSPTKIAPGYFVTKGPVGEPLPERDYFSTSFIAPFMVAAASNPKSQEWLNALWVFLDEEYTIEEDTYFGNAIRLHAYLIVSGNMVNPK